MTHALANLFLAALFGSSMSTYAITGQRGPLVAALVVLWLRAIFGPAEERA